MATPQPLLERVNPAAGEPAADGAYQLTMQPVDLDFELELLVFSLENRWLLIHTQTELAKCGCLVTPAPSLIDETFHPKLVN